MSKPLPPVTPSAPSPLPGSLDQLIGVGLVLAVWPIVVVHACYGLSVIEGHVVLCNPYWDGCSSISRAGRHGWAFFLFKAGMLPYAAALAAFWWLNQNWLHALGDPGSRGMVQAGLVGALFLVIYATFLGSEGGFYQWLRRSGIHVYFSMTFLAQALLILRLRALTRLATAPVAGGARPIGATWSPGLVTAMTAVAWLIVVLGLAFAVLGRWLAIERDRLENAIEWLAALLMQVNLLLTVVAWRSSRLTIRIEARGRR